MSRRGSIRRNRVCFSAGYMLKQLQECQSMWSRTPQQYLCYWHCQQGETEVHHCRSKLNNSSAIQIWRQNRSITSDFHTYRTQEKLFTLSGPYLMCTDISDPCNFAHSDLVHVESVDLCKTNVILLCHCSWGLRMSKKVLTLANHLFMLFRTEFHLKATRYETWQAEHECSFFRWREPV